MVIAAGTGGPVSLPQAAKAETPRIPMKLLKRDIYFLTQSLKQFRQKGAGLHLHPGAAALAASML
jgi:hypothetical protein